MKISIALFGAAVALSTVFSTVMGQRSFQTVDSPTTKDDISFAAALQTSGNPCAINVTSMSCETCVANINCFWCDQPKDPGNHCQNVNNGGFLTDIQSCPGYQWKWGQCALNGIVIAVLLALLIIFILCILCFLICCIACCCRRRRRERIARAEYQYQREREAIKDEHSRKREEKANRREEIKKKYGLFEDSGTQENDRVE